MVGIRSPDGLVVMSCTIHPGVLRLIPKREEPRKTGRHPVLKYRVPHGSHPAVYVGVVECAPASLPTASSSLTHTRRMDGFYNQNADQLGSLAGLSFPVVYVGLVSYFLLFYFHNGF
jgi:hypothetical protein